MLALTVIAVVIIVAAPLVAGWVRQHPAAGVAITLVTVMIVPYWIGISTNQQFFPFALLIFVGMLLLLGPGARTTLNHFDAFLLAFALLSGVASAISGTTWAQWVSLVLAWGVPYGLGRSIARRVTSQDLSNSIVPVATILSIWSILEFLLDWHPFVALNYLGGPWEVWATIQYRGGLPRSEGAFGHSIVLGNVLALTVPFILASTVRVYRKAILLSAVCAGILCTFSRVALICFVIAVALSAAKLYPGRPLSQKLSRLSGVALFASVGGTAYLSATTAIAGEELGNSAQYRFGYESLFPTLRAFGPASSTVALPNGKVAFQSTEYVGGAATSIDSSVLLIGLQFGWVPMLSLVLLFIALLVSTARASVQNPALIAAASLLPAVIAVAMITQLPYVYWLAVGVATQYAGQKKGPPASPRFDHPDFSKQTRTHT